MATPDLLAQITALTAEANHLAQSDSGWRLASSVRSQIKALKSRLLAEQGLYLPAPCDSHVDAYRDHLRIERVHAQMAAANSKVRAALSDIYGGRLSCSLHPRNRTVN